MPQCKRNDCREPAIPGGKRYCIEHMQAYLARRREAEKRPMCSGGCGQKTARTDPEDAFSPLCGACVQEREAKRDTAEAAARRQDWEHERMTAFDNAETVRELKEWIKDYMFDGAM